jgi:dTDP-4-dehydrorhamnose reductase
VKIAVTGARGMLGNDVCRVLADTRELVPFDIDDFDVVDSIRTLQKISECHPDLLIHCAAYTDVDGAEREPRKAFEVNEGGTKNVALVSRQLEIPLVYISTDYVFDGKKDSPYLESDPPNPLNIYGKSKLAGEQWVRKILTQFFVVRTSWLYGKNGWSFIHKILRASASGACSPYRELRVVDDQLGSPTYTVDLARALDLLVDSTDYGTYHIANTGFCSWYQLAQKTFEILGREVKLSAVTSASFPEMANRPRFSALANSTWTMVFGRQLRSWEAALRDFLQSTSIAYELQSESGD